MPTLGPNKTRQTYNDIHRYRITPARERDRFDSINSTPRTYTSEKRHRARTIPTTSQQLCKANKNHRTTKGVFHQAGESGTTSIQGRRTLIWREESRGVVGALQLFVFKAQAGTMVWPMNASVRSVLEFSVKCHSVH